MKSPSFANAFSSISSSQSVTVARAIRGRLLDVDLESTTHEVLSEIGNRIGPYVVQGPATPRHESALRVRAAVGFAETPSPPSVEIMLREHHRFEHFQRPGLLWREGRRAIVLEQKNGTTFAMEEGSVWTVNRDERALAKSTRRLLQDLMRLAAPSARMIIVKGAAIQMNDLSIVFMGDTGAGKTTMVAKALRSGRADFVSNTEVAIGMREGCNGLRVHGMPSYVMTRPELLREIPELTNLCEFLPGEDPKAPITYRDFARALGSQVVPEGANGVVVVLSPDDSPPTALDATALRLTLRQSLRYGHEWVTPWRFCMSSAHAPPSFSDEITADIANRAVAFAVGRTRPLDEIESFARGLLAHNNDNFAS